MNQEELIKAIYDQNNGTIHLNLIRLVVIEIETNGRKELLNEFNYMTKKCLDRIVSTYDQLKQVDFG